MLAEEIAATVNVVRLVIPGAPVGKARPRVTSHGTFTPAKTKRAEKDVRAVWREAGGQRLPDGPVVAHIHIYVERPQGHFTSKGALSATGRRSPFPVRKPDLDNAAKLLLDSLNGLAYRDDAQVIELHARRRWTDDTLDGGSWTVLTLLTKTLEVDGEQDELDHQDWV
jgi:Holliday junction resolvase RusA-like endonuclease